MNQFTDLTFRLLLNALMVNDPAPEESADKALYTLVENEAEKRGYSSWTEAFHLFPDESSLYPTPPDGNLI